MFNKNKIKKLLFIFALSFSSIIKSAADEEFEGSFPGLVDLKALLTKEESNTINVTLDGVDRGEIPILGPSTRANWTLGRLGEYLSLPTGLYVFIFNKSFNRLVFVKDGDDPENKIIKNNENSLESLIDRTEGKRRFSITTWQGSFTSEIRGENLVLLSRMPSDKTPKDLFEEPKPIQAFLEAVLRTKGLDKLAEIFCGSEHKLGRALKDILPRVNSECAGHRILPLGPEAEKYCGIALFKEGDNQFLTVLSKGEINQVSFFTVIAGPETTLPGFARFPNILPKLAIMVYNLRGDLVHEKTLKPNQFTGLAEVEMGKIIWALPMGTYAYKGEILSNHPSIAKNYRTNKTVSPVSPNIVLQLVESKIFFIKDCLFGMMPDPYSRSNPNPNEWSEANKDIFEMFLKTLTERDAAFLASKTDIEKIRSLGGGEIVTFPLGESLCALELDGKNICIFSFRDPASDANRYEIKLDPVVNGAVLIFRFC